MRSHAAYSPLVAKSVFALELPAIYQQLVFSYKFHSVLFAIAIFSSVKLVRHCELFFIIVPLFTTLVKSNAESIQTPRFALFFIVRIIDKLIKRLFSHTAIFDYGRIKHSALFDRTFLSFVIDINYTEA